MRILNIVKGWPNNGQPSFFRVPGEGQIIFNICMLLSRLPDFF
jgi:hypothetical protein